MVELAFEVVVRVFIAILILALVSLILSSIFDNLERRVEAEVEKKIEFPIVIEASNLGEEDFIAYAKTCRDYFYEEAPREAIEPCFIFKKANQYSLQRLANIGENIEVKSISVNAIMSYDSTRDVVIIE